ncbi:MAG: glycoside hydrolase family 57 protein [Prevotellaceae bacterium]|jgi:alpha-amylase|nr:glycoside hydrolase family 57 protein [Prevotellaceae bacterium]
MKNLCFYFEIHQPLRLKRYRFFDVSNNHYYYDDFQTEERIRALVEQSYLPANLTIAEMIRSSNGKFKCAFSISGIMLDLFEQYAPEIIDSFKELAKTKSVEFLAEPYAHSLASVFNTGEFETQVKMHSDKIENLFGKRPVSFRNAELIYSDEIGELVSKMGYKVMLIDEARHILGWKSPDFVYNHAYLPKLKLLVRNHKLSDDIAFRFSDHSWIDFPLTADKYIGWIKDSSPDENIVNIWMGYEAIGYFQHYSSGIFEFLKALPYKAMEQELNFILPSEAGKKIEPAGSLAVPYPISWSGHEKDLSPWTGNDLQQEALNKLYAVAERVHLCNDRPLKYDWLMLQATDHFRYMSHKDPFGTNYESPYEAFINYMNVLADFLERVDAQYPASIENEELNELLKTINNQEKIIVELEEEIAKLQKKKNAGK